MSFLKSLTIAGSPLVILFLVTGLIPSEAVSAPIMLKGFQYFSSGDKSSVCHQDYTCYTASVNTFQFNVIEDAEYIFKIRPKVSLLYKPYFRLFSISLDGLSMSFTTGGELDSGFWPIAFTGGQHRLHFSFGGPFNGDDVEGGSQYFQVPRDAEPLESFKYKLMLRPVPVPEPSILILLTLGLSGLGLLRKKY